MRMVPSLKKYLPFLLVACGPCILLAYPILTGQSLFWGTPALQFIPWRVYAFDRILQGGLPFLNSLNGMTAPLLANYQLAIFYPFTWLSFPFYLIGDTPLMAWSMDGLLLLHLCIGGMGMAVLIRQWSQKTTGMVVGGLAFCLSGYWVSRLSFFSIIWCGVWLPWEMFLINDILLNEDEHKNQTGPFLKLVLVTSMQLLSGHAQLTWYSFAVIYSWTIVYYIFQKKNKFSFQKWAIIFSSLALALGLSAVQLIPTAEYLMQSQRALAVDYTKSLSYSFWPWHFLGFITPNLFGSPANGDYWGYLSYWEDAVYIGILPLISALYTLILFFKSQSETEPLKNWAGRKLLIGFGWVCIGIAAILALGLNTPIFPFLFKYVPSFNQFNAPSRLMLIVVFFLCWFSGIGINTMQRPRIKYRRWLRKGIGMCISIMIGAIAAKYMLPEIKSTFILPVIQFAIFLGLSLWLIVRKPVLPDTKLWNILVVAIVALDLLLPTYLFNPYLPSNFYQRPATNRTIPEYNDRVFIDQQQEYKLKFSKYLRFNDFSAPGDWNLMRTAYLPNMNMLDGVYSASNFDPLVPARFQDWLDQYDQADPSQKDNMLKDMDVKTLLLTDFSGSPNGVKKVDKQAIGLVHWAACASWAETQDSALKTTINNAEPNQVVVEGIPPAWGNSSCGHDQAVVATKLQNAENIKVQINSDQAGWLWISNVYYPGWEMRLDQKPIDVQKVNYLFFGAYIPEGIHEIEFMYTPYTFYWGLFISIICAVILITMFITALKNNPRNKPPV